MYLVTAAILAAMTATFAAWRYVNGAVLSDEVTRVYEIIMGILVVTWLVKDPDIPVAHKPSFDHGLFVWYSFPLLAAYHMYTAHRWRGIAMIVGLMLLFAAPRILVTLIDIGLSD
jgi:hypothetical protein